MPDNPLSPVSVDASGLFGPSELTTTTTSEPWKALQGPIKDYISALQGATYPGGHLAPYPYPDQRVSVFDPLQMYGQIIAGQQALQNAPLSAQADQLAMQTMGGAYLSPDSNPYLKDTFNQAAQSVSDVYRYSTAPTTQAEFARAGAFGGSANNQARDMQQFSLGQNLNDLATQIYGGNYQQERGRQLNEQAMLPTLQQFGATIPTTIQNIGQQRQGLQQTGFDTNYQNQMQRAQYPYQMLQMLGQGLGQFTGAGGTQTTTGPNPNQMSPLAALLAVEQMQSGGGGGGFGSILPFLLGNGGLF